MSSRALSWQARRMLEIFHRLSRRPWIRHHTIISQLYDYWHPEHQTSVAEYFDDMSDFWIRSVAMSDAIETQRLLKICAESDDFDNETEVQFAYRDLLKARLINTDGCQLLTWSLQ